MQEIVQRAQILLQQQKYTEAAKLLQQCMLQDPHDIQVLSLLAETYLQQDDYDKAETLINTAISIDPGEPVLFHQKSRVLLMKDEYDDAEENIAHAVELDPGDADYYAFWSSIKLMRKQYQAGLDLADQALGLNPEHLLALNNRSKALVKVKNFEESFRTIEGALREDPNNSYTHANYGWNLLEHGDHKKALEHFREALQNDPNNDYARSGMMEALKASNAFYRLFLKYSFWIGNLTAKYQWGVILGFYLGTKAIKLVAQKNEALQPYLLPVIILLALIAFSTWVITPISNLFLRLNKYGKHLLDRDEKRSSNLVGISLLLCITGLIAYFATSDERMVTIAVFGFVMMVPLGSVFSRVLQKNKLVVYTLLMAALGIAGIVNSFITGDVLNIFNILFLFSFIAYQFLANYFQIRASNK